MVIFSESSQLPELSSGSLQEPEPSQNLPISCVFFLVLHGFLGQHMTLVPSLTPISALKLQVPALTSVKMGAVTPSCPHHPSSCLWLSPSHLRTGKISHCHLLPRQPLICVDGLCAPDPAPLSPQTFFIPAVTLACQNQNSHSRRAAAE